MVVMFPPGANFAQPAVSGMRPAECLLDAGIHEEPVNFRHFRGDLQYSFIGFRPLPAVDQIGMSAQYRRRMPVFAFVLGQCSAFGLFRQQEPDVDIQPGLVAAVSAQGRAAARLSHVADQQHAKVFGCGALPQGFDKMFQVGVAEITVPGKAHYLIARSVWRQFDGAAQAAGCIGADAFGGKAGGGGAFDAGPRIAFGLDGVVVR